MSIDILFDCDQNRAVFVCTTSNVAFGPVFRSLRDAKGRWLYGAREQAERFLRFLAPRDPRELDELQTTATEFGVEQKFSDAPVRECIGEAGGCLTYVFDAPPFRPPDGCCCSPKCHEAHLERDADSAEVAQGKTHTSEVKP